MPNPYQLANIESDREKSAFDSRTKIQSSNIATGIKKGDMSEELQKLITQASDKPFSLLDLIPGVGTLKDLMDRNKLYKKASSIDKMFGNTFLRQQSGDFKEKAEDLQYNPLEIGQSFVGDFMSADLMKNTLSGIFKGGTPFKSLIENIQGMDFGKGGNMKTFNNLAIIQKMLSNFGSKL
tara:strand:+ start:138 stop:677 length:540 start_codon:yes stop_codon:yes gene_type:complete